MMQQVSVKLEQRTGRHPLWTLYPGQTEPQPAYVHLDGETGRLWAEPDWQIGGAVTFRVWHGHELRWEVPNELTADESNQLLRRVSPLAEAVVAGYGCVWDGHNEIAKYTIAARQAIDKIRGVCDAAVAQSGGVWDAGDWLSGLSDEELGVLAESTDEDLATAAEALEDEAWGENETSVSGMYEELVCRRDACRREAEIESADRRQGS